MPGSTPFRRVLVKLSGEALAAPDGYWLHPPTLAAMAEDVARTIEQGMEIAIVVGGGNMIRGARISAAGWIDRATGDSLGMMATVMNSLAIETALNAAGVQARTMSAVSMPTICETYARQPALHHLDKGQVVVLAGGTGNPYFTTDTAAVLRAAELRCDAVLKATQVDGVYSADPRRIRLPPATTASPTTRPSPATSRSWTPPPSPWPGRAACPSWWAPCTRRARSRQSWPDRRPPPTSFPSASFQSGSVSRDWKN